LQDTENQQRVQKSNEEILNELLDRAYNGGFGIANWTSHPKLVHGSLLKGFLGIWSLRVSDPRTISRVIIRV